MAATLLFGCGSSIKSADKKANNHYSTEVSPQHGVKLRYIRRYLYETSYQRQYVADALNQQIEINKQGGSTFFHSDLALVGDAITGTTNSSLGLGLGLGVSLLDAIITDEGDNRYVSGAYLPEMYNGAKLDTALKARATLVGETITKLQIIADTYGLTLTCEFDCDDKIHNQVWRLEGVGSHELISQYIYRPESILVRVKVGDFRAANDEEKVIMSQFIGAEVKWSSIGIAGYSVEFYVDHEYSAERGIWNSPMDSLASYRIHRDMGRFIYSTNNLFYAKRMGERSFYIGGNYYITTNPMRYTTELPLLPVTPVPVPYEKVSVQAHQPSKKY